MFDFNKLTVDQSALLKKKPSTTSKLTDLPEGIDLRITRKCKFIVSKAFAQKWDLEFRSKDDKDQGNGLDIVWSKQLEGYPEEAPECHFIGITRRGEAKISAFASTRSYDDEGKPKASVLSGTSNENTITFANEIFNYTEGSDGKDFLDLVVLPHDIAASNGGAMMIPKIIKGQTEVSPYSRPHIKLFPVMLGTEELKSTLEVKETEELAQEINESEVVKQLEDSVVNDIPVFDMDSAEDQKVIEDAVQEHNVNEDESIAAHTPTDTNVEGSGQISLDDLLGGI